MSDREDDATATYGLTNVILVLSVLKGLGGAEKFVDIEDVAEAAYRISQDRFGWRTREYPSWERVRTAFVHANQNEQRRGRPPLVHSSKDGTGWRLTAEGVALARQTESKTELVTRKGAPPKQTGKSGERVKRMKKHRAYLAFANGTPVRDIERYLLADLLLCPPDASMDAVSRKVNAARASAVDVGDRAVERFLDELERELPEKWS